MRRMLAWLHDRRWRRSPRSVASERISDLPADLQAITITATGTLTPQYALVHLFAEKGYKGYALVDSAGRIAWHYRTKDYPFAADRRKNGNFVFMDKGHGLVEVDRTGAIVHELKQRDPEREMHHAIVVTPQDTVLYLAFDTETFNGKPLKGEAIWEWNPDTGEDVKRWRSWDFMDPALDRSARTAGEWLHGNSLSIGPGGNILLSFHYIDQVISIAPDWKSIQWRLGGVRPTIVGAEGSADLGAAHRRRARPGTHPDVRQPHRAATAVLARGGVPDRRQHREAGVGVAAAEGQLRVGGQLRAAAGRTATR